MAEPAQPVNSPGPGWKADQIDTSGPQSARTYDRYLGGRSNYQPDRDLADRVVEVFPTAGEAASANRAFMHRAVGTLAAQGTDQFLDIGTGIPHPPNLHEAAQAAAPRARVLYVDNDPIVLTHARALLTSTPQGVTRYLHADLRDPRAILDSPVLRDTLDLTRPVCLSLLGILHFLPDDDGPHQIVRRLVDALAPGSHLMLSQATGDFDPGTWEQVVEIHRTGGIPAQVRSKTEVTRFFDGLDLLAPGVVPVHRWNPGSGTGAHPALTDAQISVYAGVARKP